ncbi:MAG TPA: hypothetical protein VI385_07170, partial [Flavisolibacter sp.]
GMEEMQQQLQAMFQNLGGNRTRTRKVKVREALKLLTDEEAGKLINEDELKIQALANAEALAECFAIGPAVPGTAFCY